jgi:membrane protein DedA with SNARE-associated domain
VNEQILEWFSAYGLPVYFCILAASSVGIPMPVKLTMLVIGSFVVQEEIQFWQALLVGSAGAAAGDQIGYFLGRFGGRNLTERITNRFGGAEKIERAEEFASRWGAIGIFFSRWLVTPLGPWLNLLSGTTFYSWTIFTALSVAGETLWVLIYVLLGIFFSDRIQSTADFLTNLSWAIVGLAAAGFLGWKVFQYFRNSDEKTS